MGHCELQQPDGEEEVEAKLQGGVGGGTTTGVTRQPAGKQEANGRGGIQVAKGRGVISRQEAAEHREDKRGQRHDVRRCDNSRRQKQSLLLLLLLHLLDFGFPKSTEE